MGTIADVYLLHLVTFKLWEFFKTSSEMMKLAADLNSALQTTLQTIPLL